MNDDWYPELLWVCDFRESMYLVNNADGTFSDQTAASGTGLDENGMGNTFGDFDSDGDIDWYVTAIHDPQGPLMRMGNRLYINQGAHTFTETAFEAGADDGEWGWGVEAADLDHDTDLDIAETNGAFFEFPAWVNNPARLFINHGDATFTESAAALGFHHTGQGRGLARIDYDNDGDQDVLIFSNEQPLLLLRNDLAGPDTNWLRVFIDTAAREDLAPHGVGARVRVITPTLTQRRTLDAGANFLASSELSAHFGLAGATSVTLETEWHDGTLVRLENVPANQTITVAAPSCRADLAPPFESLDFSDVLRFLVYFTQQRPAADLAPPAGVYDFSDILAFLTLFGAPCV